MVNAEPVTIGPLGRPPVSRYRLAMPLSLTDQQLSIVMQAAAVLPPEKRSDYLQRISATLAVRHGFRFTNDDVVRAVNEALKTLVHHHADSAA